MLGLDKPELLFYTQNWQEDFPLSPTCSPAARRSCPRYE